MSDSSVLEPSTFQIQFPGDLEYIPSIRKFVSEVLQVCGFSSKFAYRTEIIVDELCNNAVTYGCLSADAKIGFTCVINDDQVEFKVQDEGGSRDDIDRLKRVVQGRDRLIESAELAEIEPAPGLGLEIVRMLSEQVRVEFDENDLMSIHVVRKRDSADGGPRQQGASR